jgi:TfoX/Sxy family transcriptional regulator of competence genes
MKSIEEFTDYVLDQLSDLGVIHTSRMFGGTLLKAENKQLGVIIKGTFYFKAKEPELQKKFERMGSEQFSYERKNFEGPVVITSWWSVPEEILEDQNTLVALAHEVLLQGT